MIRQFKLDCIPPKVTAQQQRTRCIPRNGKYIPMKYDTPEIVKAREMFCLLLFPHRDFDTLTVPVSCRVDWIFPWRKTEKKSVTKSFSMVMMDKSPDCDNLSKLFNDCLEKTGFVKNDSLIYDNRHVKWWGDDPGIVVKMCDADYNVPKNENTNRNDD